MFYRIFTFFLSFIFNTFPPSNEDMKAKEIMLNLGAKTMEVLVAYMYFLLVRLWNSKKRTFLKLTPPIPGSWVYAKGGTGMQ